MTAISSKYDTEGARGGFEPLRLPSEKGKEKEKIVVLGLVTSKSGTLEKKR